MKNTLYMACLILGLSLLGTAAPILAQEAPPTGQPQAEAVPPAPAEPAGFEQAAGSLQQRLETSLQELQALRTQSAQEMIPLSRQLGELENELTKARQEFQQTTRVLDSRTLDLTNLRNEIKSRSDEVGYLTSLLTEYIRNFESRLHIAELQRYRDVLREAGLASENTQLSGMEVFKAKQAVLLGSLDRLDEALGGVMFDGSAVGTDGLVKNGQFLLVGPWALFMSEDSAVVGTVEQRLGSLEPNITPFSLPEDSLAAGALLKSGSGLMPMDPTMGNAHKIEETQETLVEHIKKGGPVMWPIFIVAGLALLVAIFKWVTLTLIPKPSTSKVKAVLDAIAKRDQQAAMKAAKAMKGPIGAMVQVGVEHMKEPGQLVEEMMYERVLVTRLKVNRLIPFIAIAASSAPLLGLLGTVTGIINTFKLITVFGTGDVKTLSSGISEALITTEYGLYVAIPSLLLHALLSRKAKGFLDRMENVAINFMNQLNKTPLSTSPTPSPEPQTKPVEKAA